MSGRMLVIVQFAVGTVLLLASAGKWRNPMRFARGVADYEMLPNGLSLVFGLLLIPLETLVAAAHLTGWWISIAVPAGLIMFAGFSVAVAVNLARGRSLPCYCFGNEEGDSISAASLTRLLLLLAGEGLLLFSPGGPGVSGFGRQPLAGPQELVLVLFWTALLVIAAMWALSLPDFLELVQFRRPQPRNRRAGISSVGAGS